MAHTRAAAPAVNHYKILGVAPSASPREIRESFKRLVIEAHPDKNPDRPRWSEKRIRQLIEAFDVVGNEEKRAEFDRILGVTRRVRRTQEKPFFYYKKDPEARALLILHHLLNKRPKSAVPLLKEMETIVGEDFLVENLDRADYLDCLFLLAEHYSENRQYVLAAETLGVLYTHEKESRFPRHYMAEVISRLKDLYLKRLPRFASAEKALAGLRKAKSLGLSKAEEAMRLCHSAEMLARLGETEEARRQLALVRELSPDHQCLGRVQKTIEVAERSHGKEASGNN